MKKVILKLEDITKTFPGVLALNKVSFDLYSGEVHAICGENGAGKSTLMKVVSGVYPPDGGTMYVNGKKRKFSNPMEAFESGISIIYQETNLFEEMTVLENLFIGHEIHKKVAGISVLDYSSMREKAKAVFKRLNTKINLNTKIKNLGMAQKQMVEIAKALTIDINILILDEPTASLTEREVKALFETIRQLKKQGYGVVYISHRIEEIFEICDRVTVIRDGTHISTKNVSDTNEEELVADMVGRSLNNYYPKAETAIGQEIFRVERLYDNGFVTDVSFTLKKGEILGFAGLAGAGRTELMQAICGLSKRIKGDLYIDQKKVKIENYNQAKANGIVYVSEDRGKYGLIIDMSIAQNISLPQLQNFSNRYHILNLRKEQKTADRYIKEVDIKAPSNDFLVTNLSGGNQQKVSVAKALALHPKILIMDEPTRGVDVNAKAEIHKIISKLTQQGLSIIMVSSELPELIGMCDRTYVMRNGKISAMFLHEESTQEKILKAAI